MTICVRISGEVCLDEVVTALSVHFKQEVGIGTENNDTADSIYVSLLDNAQSAIIAKDKKIKELEIAAENSLTSIQTFHNQQRTLFDEFVLLRQKYDEQKVALVTVLWSQCALHHPELRHIPSLESSDECQESEERLGKYTIGEQLGEGQFASVMECWKDGNSQDLALKVIVKDRVTTFTMLQRVSNEIFALRSLKNDCIVKLVDVVHTTSKLYIIAEKGGADLFEFFDAHAEGVCENWALNITVNIMKAVIHCHEFRICHRDLKPENILIQFNTATGTCTDLKICDFGLSTSFQSKTILTDFCGSPGFFAPEMIIQGGYYGDKADIWSVGCILLELIVGHESFCTNWMNSYDYELLHDKVQFNDAISCSVKALPDALTSVAKPFSDNLQGFVVDLLNMRSTERPSAKEISLHPWLGGRCAPVVDPLSSRSISNSRRPTCPATPPPPSSRPGSGDKKPPGLEASSLGTHASPLSPMDMLKIMNGGEHADLTPNAVKTQLKNANISVKERRLYEGEHAQNDDDVVLHLPPITPSTPNVINARKILRRGQEIVNSAPIGSLDTPTQSPVKTTHKPHTHSAFPSPK